MPVSGHACPDATIQVSLVQMPYCELERPSLGIALLKAYLTQAGITSAVQYANIDFATEFGLDVYQAIVHTPAETLVGEWTFAAAAFGDAAPDRDTFLAAIGPVLPQQGWSRWPQLELSASVSRVTSSPSSATGGVSQPKDSRQVSSKPGRRVRRIRISWSTQRTAGISRCGKRWKHTAPIRFVHRVTRAWTQLDLRLRTTTA